MTVYVDDVKEALNIRGDESGIGRQQRVEIENSGKYV